MQEFYSSISGSSIKYIANLRSKANMISNNITFKLDVGLVGDQNLVHQLVGLPNIAKMKVELDKMVLDMQEHFMEGSVSDTPQISANVTAAIPASV